MGVIENQGETSKFDSKFHSKITLFLDNNIIYSSEYSNYAIAVYCILQILTATIPSRHYITPYEIAFYLTNDEEVSRNRRFIDCIKCGLGELIDSGIVIKCGEYQKGYIIDSSYTWINTKKGNFTIIYYDELQKIFSLDGANSFLLLKYFITLIGTIISSKEITILTGETKNKVVGNYTIDYIAKKAGISTKSAMEYNKILEGGHLIYVYRHHDFGISEEGEIKRLKNVYGRYRDKEYIDSFAAYITKRENSYKYIGMKKDANSRRRLAQIYIQLKNGNDEKYSDDEITATYHYVVEENKKYTDMIEKNGDDNYLSKIRDTNIFLKYDFLFNSEGENETKNGE